MRPKTKRNKNSVEILWCIQQFSTHGHSQKTHEPQHQWIKTNFLELHKYSLKIGARLHKRKKQIHHQIIVDEFIHSQFFFIVAPVYLIRFFYEILLSKMHEFFLQRYFVFSTTYKYQNGWNEYAIRIKIFWDKNTQKSGEKDKTNSNEINVNHRMTCISNVLYKNVLHIIFHK